MLLRTQKGMTLIELVMVIIIIGIIAGVAMKSMDGAIETGRVEATKAELEALAQAIVGNPELVSNGSRIDFGYVGDIGALPPNLDALVNNPGGYGTWRGPYIRNSFAQATDDYSRDGWNTLYSYNGGITIVSTGSGSNITKTLANAVSDLTSNSIQGVILDVEGIPPGSYSADVEITITFPDGAGSVTTATVNPSSSGAYSFTGLPMGNHTVVAVNGPTGDSLISYVTVPPRSTVTNNLRFGLALWGAGNASTGNGLQYVAGSATLSGGNNVEFDIYNNTGAGITVSWLKATYVRNPAAYFERVRWGNANVASSSNPRYGSGSQVTFNSSKTINDGSTVTIQLQDFNTAANGGGAAANMAGVSFSVLFSDSSTVTFSL